MVLLLSANLKDLSWTRELDHLEKDHFKKEAQSLIKELGISEADFIRILCFVQDWGIVVREEDLPVGKKLLEARKRRLRNLVFKRRRDFETQTAS